jgi:hypothetical protein
MLLVFTAGATLGLFLLLPALGALDCLKDVVLNHDSQKIQGTAELTLKFLGSTHPASLLAFAPLPQEELVERLELPRFNYEFLPRAGTEVRIDDSQMFEETHQFAATDVQGFPLSALRQQTPA